MVHLSHLLKLLALVLLAGSCSGTVTVGENGAATPVVSTPVAPTPIAPTPVAPAQDQAQESAPAGDWETAFAKPTGRAPLVAIGAGGSCLAADGQWANGFEVGVYLSDASDIGAVTVNIMSAPYVLAVATLPATNAWDRLSTDLSTTNALDSLSPDDVANSFMLTIFGSNDAADDELASMIDDLRDLPGVFAITDSRCTNQPNAHLVDG